MDTRWEPTARDSVRDVRVILHPTASIFEVTTGVYVTPYDDPADDSVDLTDFVTQGSQSFFEVSVTLTWNSEFFGTAQPKIHQVLEVQEWQNSEWKISWIGQIDGINGLTISRGQRTMQLIARSREATPGWKDTRRVSPLYPVMTDLMYMVKQAALVVGLREEEIQLPAIHMPTAHASTQMADMSAWDIITQILLALGFTPYIDTLGRLKAANRELQYRDADVILTTERVVQATGSSQRPGKSRVRVDWLNPIMTKARSQGRMIKQETISMGWWLPFLHRKVYYSEDKTQRAESVNMVIKTSVNSLHLPFCTEQWNTLGENYGRINLTNYAFAATIFAMLAGWYAAHYIPDESSPGGGPVIPVGRKAEAAYQIAFTVLLLNVGTGDYEIWGTPYEWVHARNQTEAFNDTLPVWIDEPEVIESDFVTNEPHAQALAIRELIYLTRQAKKYQFTMCDDHRVEYGDIVQFPDGSQIWVEDVSRDIMRGSEATIEVSGFLMGVAQ